MQIRADGGVVKVSTKPITDWTCNRVTGHPLIFLGHAPRLLDELSPLWHFRLLFISFHFSQCLRHCRVGAVWLKIWKTGEGGALFLLSLALSTFHTSIWIACSLETFADVGSGKLLCSGQCYICHINHRWPLDPWPLPTAFTNSHHLPSGTPPGGAPRALNHVNYSPIVGVLGRTVENVLYLTSAMFRLMGINFDLWTAAEILHKCPHIICTYVHIYVRVWINVFMCDI